MVDFLVAARALKAINFDGPTEWTGLGGAENGRDTLTVPRETVISLLKHDYDTSTRSSSPQGWDRARFQVRPPFELGPAEIGWA
jgi:hypothetical protein